MVQSLDWEPLQHRRYTNRLTMLFKIQHGIVDVTPDFVQLNDQRSRGSQRLRQLQATNDVYKYSFYPRTISDWNRLPTSVTDQQTLQGFREDLANLPPLLLAQIHQPPVHSFNWGMWVFLSVLIGHRSFSTG